MGCKGDSMKGKIIITMLFFVCLLACANADRDYAAACKANNIEKYNHFLKTYPDDQHKSEILSRIEELTWTGAKKTNTIEAVDNYVKGYPNGKFIEEAKLFREKLVFDSLPVWEGVVSINMIAPNHRPGAGFINLVLMVGFDSGGEKYQLFTNDDTQYKGVKVFINDNTKYKGMKMNKRYIEWKPGKRYKVKGELTQNPPENLHMDKVKYINAKVVELLN